MSNRTTRNLLAAAAGAAVLTTPVVACGPFFPNQLLFDGSKSIRWAPTADLTFEINRLKPATTLHAVVPENHQDVYEQTTAVETADLRAALNPSGLPADQRDLLVERYTEIRKTIAEYARSVSDPGENGAPAARPAFPDVIVPEGLPAEFAAYLRGLVQYHSGHFGAARAEWQAVLQLPADQRRYRTVWAQFMIGRSYQREADPARAVTAFRAVRDAVSAGQSDSLGLAATSLGWEGRAELDRAHFRRAAELYLEQHAAGDPTAVNSIAILCQQVFRRDDRSLLRTLASDPVMSRVLTAYVLARGGHFRDGPTPEAAGKWLDAVEAAGTSQVIGADRLAWAAYQRDDIATAEKWVARAPDDAPIGLWVKSKLLLRAGKVDAAAESLAKAARSFPPAEHWDVAGGFDAPEAVVDEDFTPAKRAAAELGVLQLSLG
ncbi:MAG TPA: hypothetical protein VLJ39_23015, partial [Tepidisphaeraceae bacterium]|nr:hypothetical protein [Tepidisphaeraceae bacterium]